MIVESFGLKHVNDKKKTKSEPRKCKRCGACFTPYQRSRRLYCYSPRCEEARLADDRHRCKMHARKKREEARGKMTTNEETMELSKER